MLTTPLKVTTTFDINLLPTADTSPHIILKKHTSELLGIISDPDKLAVDMWSADLVPDPVKDNVLTTLGISRFQKSSKLLDEVYRSLKEFNSPDILVKFCEILKIQRNAGLTRIADDMLKQLSGEYYYSVCVCVCVHVILVANSKYIAINNHNNYYIYNYILFLLYRIMR